MTLTDIQQEVTYLLAGEPVNLQTISKYTNKCMDVLSTRYDTACIKAAANVVCTDTAAIYDAPEGCTGVYTVYFGGYKYRGYEINGDGMTFGSTGTYDVHYYTKPVLPHRTSLDTSIKTDVPPIDVAYHKCIPKYIACELIKIASPKDARVSIFTEDFLLESKEVDARLKRLKRKNRRVYAPAWG